MSLPLGMDGDPAAIERDIDQTRAHVERVLDALQTKLSPRQLRAQARHYIHERSVQALNRMKRKVRDNPVPLLVGVLVAIGWVVLVRRHRRGPARAAQALRHRP